MYECVQAANNITCYKKKLSIYLMGSIGNEAGFEYSYCSLYSFFSDTSAIIEGFFIFIFLMLK